MEFQKKSLTKLAGPTSNDKIVIFVTSEAQFWPRTSASARVGEPKLRLRVANISFYHE